MKLPADATGRKFDNEKEHGLSQGMKAVDFIVKWKNRIFFIEFKDPDHPEAKPEDREEFINKFFDGNIDRELMTKYRDSWLYE